MNYFSIFYWLTVADQAKVFFLVFAIVLSVIGIVTMIINLGAFDHDDEDRKVARKWVFWSWPLMILFWALWIFTPAKKDALLIVAGGGALNYLTTDSAAKSIPHELSTFVLTELKSMSEQAKVEIDVRTTKEKALDEAKKMTTEELLAKMKINSNFAKIILNK